MNLANLRHQSDSRYCFSIDDHTVLLRLAVSKDIHLGRVDILYGDTANFYKKQARAKMTLAHEDEAFFYYEGKMEARIPRFFYIFHLSENGCDFFYSESGLSVGYKFDLAYLSAFQYVGENRNDYTFPLKAWQGRVVYQIFPERFASSSRLDKSYVTDPWQTTNLRLNHQVFLGGDLWGVYEKLDYIASLGIGVLYLTPIHPSPTNHKYDVLDYFDVDAHFGGKEAFKAVVEKAHSLGMKVMMDLVFNHMCDKHPFFQDVKKKGRASPYYDWFFIDGDKPTASPLNYVCFTYVTSMPKMDTNNPKVRDYLISVGKYWLEEFDVDGYRLDVSEGVSHDFWIRFKLALKENHPDVILVGENWHNSESFLGPDQLDSVMNYPFLNIVSGYVLSIEDAEITRQRFDGLLMRYKSAHNELMLNILSSHDIQRLMNLCHGDKDRVLMAYAIGVFYPGMPMIYYGEEVLMEGGGDPDNRRGMRWDLVEHPDYYANTFKALLHLREREELQVGKSRFENAGGLLKISRICGDSSIAIYMNMTDSPLPLAKLGEELLSHKAAGGSVYPKGFLAQRE